MAGNRTGFVFSTVTLSGGRITYYESVDIWEGDDDCSSPMRAEAINQAVLLCLLRHKVTWQFLKIRVLKDIFTLI